MNKDLYPLKFSPILKEKVWGGNKLNNLLNKKSDLPNIGESWEISDVEGDSSIAINGSLKGKSLSDLINTYKDDLVGKKNFEQFDCKFPLLIKFIDAKQNLSIQLHPNDTLAKKRHNSFGKTEMWYVMQADKDSELIVGFNRKISKKDYQINLERNSLTDILNFDKVTEGDCYFIEVGRVHAIGAGVLLAEIQQTSDITYRLYDWDRKDATGQGRELHTELALDAIDFKMKDNFRVEYKKDINLPNSMVTCQYFTTNYLHITNKTARNNKFDSFIIYMCVEGDANIRVNEKSEHLLKGETILIPAVFSSIEIESDHAKLLEIYV